MDKDDVVLDSKIWEFKDIKELVEGKGGRKVVLVGMYTTTSIFQSKNVPSFRAPRVPP